MLISQNTIYLFDVKNYEGDFYIKEDKWYSIATGKEIQNPLNQLSRCTSLFRRYLQDLGINNFSINEFLIFINPEFTLYEAPRNQPIVLPTQLNRFLNNLNSKTSKISDYHFKLAEQIMSDYLNQNPYIQLPKFEYKQFKKGVACKICYSFLANFNDKEFICKNCGCKERNESAIIRNVKEFSILFPDNKITTNIIHEWCNLQISKKAIRRILMKYLSVCYHGRYSYYVYPPQNNE
ncbi:nuclease-related domain-containing protein [Lederbergia citrisecunda]|uniref:nuclease-related domain-containing protein n=1 Tax=Lederbergia citrisecunda TaxID=2833583 RepID=UPI001F329B67|nr:nuclease-related domain-containing protein [Lederbergia citrisecunda]